MALASIELPVHPDIVKRGTPTVRSLYECIEVESSIDGRLKYLPQLARVAMSLAVAHAQGIAHGSVTARNIVVGPYQEVYICAWRLAANDPSGLVKDTAALGAILQFMIVGRPPYPGTQERVMQGILVGHPGLADRVIPRVPRQLTSIVNHALTHRYQHSAELGHDLLGYVNKRPTVAHRWSIRDPIHVYLRSELPSLLVVILIAIPAILILPVV